MRKLLLLSLFALASLASFAYGIKIDDIYYDFIDGEASVTSKDGSFKSYSGTVTIPSSVDYNGITYPVTSIGDYAFAYSFNLTSVTIPNSITSIGENAFSSCSGLTSITIPNSITSIGFNAFYKCSGLTSINIPNSVTTIGEDAFWGCSGLTEVTGGRNVTSIGGGAFYNCNAIRKIGIGDKVPEIPEYCFYGCEKLLIVTLGKNVSSIGTKAFYNCPLVRIYAFPEYAPSIGTDAFTIVKEDVKVYVIDDLSYDIYKADTGWADFNLQIMDATALAIEGLNASEDTNATRPNGKFLRNGRIEIVKNGQRYNTTGQRLGK